MLDVIKYYSGVADIIFASSADREVAFAYSDGMYDKRPNMLQYKTDVVQMAKKGITSFHFSVERWTNPMMISAERYDELRKGFDIILDIDSGLGIGEAQLAGKLICSLLGKYGIKNYGVKFSGRRGFHISIPWEMIPDKEMMKSRYPEIPRLVSTFIRERISADLMKELIKTRTAKELMKSIDKPADKLDPFMFIEVEKDWGNRHMFRAPYSLNEKTWLVSLPLDRIENFNIELARPENVKPDPDLMFIRGEKNEAELLVIDALDWAAVKLKAETPKRKKQYTNSGKRIGEEMFPPCMKLALNGLNDGRKRSVFTIVSFLKAMNWNWDEIEEKLKEWNSRNKMPLPTSILLGQMRWAQQNSRTPANCFHHQFYVSIGICQPDDRCKKIKNPINYPFTMMKKAVDISKEKKIKKPKLYKCGICNEAFETDRSLAMHKGRSH